MNATLNYPIPPDFDDSWGNCLLKPWNFCYEQWQHVTDIRTGSLSDTIIHIFRKIIAAPLLIAASIPSGVLGLVGKTLKIVFPLTEKSVKAIDLPLYFSLFLCKTGTIKMSEEEKSYARKLKLDNAHTSKLEVSTAICKDLNTNIQFSCDVNIVDYDFCGLGSPVETRRIDLNIFGKDLHVFFKSIVLLINNEPFCWDKYKFFKDNPEELKNVAKACAQGDGLKLYISFDLKYIQLFITKNGTKVYDSKIGLLTQS